VIGVSSVTPITGWSRSTVHVMSGRRRASPWTSFSISPRSRWKRVAPRSVAAVAMSSVKNAWAAGALP
jgi:hypothetical protein